MADLNVNYLGLKLDNPIVAGSSSLSENIDGIKELERHKIGAIVLKSLFEEEIIRDLELQIAQMTKPAHIYPEIFDYFDSVEAEDTVSKYLFLIEEAKKAVKVPIIASVNCVSSEEWPKFAKKIEEAGADALELNAFILPSDFSRTAEDNEKIYFDIIDKVKKEIKIPISFKMSYYFSNLGTFIQKLSKTGVKGITLFNRYYSPDIDIDKMIVKPADIYSHPDDLPLSLRWIAIMAQRVDCDLAASTGVHDGAALIKQLLAGADVVHIASTLYKNGLKQIETMLEELKIWMNNNNFEKINDFRARLSQAKSSNPAAFERVQFMKHFSGK